MIRYGSGVLRNTAERKAGNSRKNASFPIGQCPTPRLSTALVSFTKQRSALSPTTLMRRFAKHHQARGMMAKLYFNHSKTSLEDSRASPHSYIADSFD